MKWYIGQRIVAIEDHEYGCFTKGDEFIIQSLRTSFCKCNEIEIDIGIPAISRIDYCGTCNTNQLSISNQWWFSEKRFAPRDEDNYENVDISELTEILKEPLITTQ